MFDVSLGQFLIDNAVIDDADAPGKIQYHHNAEGVSAPRIWYTRTSQTQDLGISGTQFITTTEFNMEVISDDVAEALTIAEDIRSLLHGYRGSMGTDTALYVTVEDRSDDYQPFLTDDDKGNTVAALSIKILS